MKNQFIKYINKENLFEKQDRILLAVSGGIDSVVMCDLFHKTRFDFAIAHCNFGLRGAESDGDELLVKNLAKKYKVPFYKIKFDTEVYAKSEGISIQMAARKLRYDWFEKIRIENNYNYISVAHHRDDSVETFFINLIRGTGISGLHGILPKNKFIIRPLLFASREVITNYCKENNLIFREDSSNLSDKYLRNNIRLNIIPALKNLNPNITETISQDIERLKEIEEIYRSTIETKRKELLTVDPNGNIRIEINALKKLTPIKTWLFELLSPFNFNITSIENLVSSFDKTSGKQFLSSSHRIIKDRDVLIITPLNIDINTEIKISKDQDSISEPISLKITRKGFTTDFSIPKSSTIACLDAEKLRFPLTLRKWKNGDYFYPLGMKSRKKISDFFIDNKVSLNRKEEIYVLESDKKIVWIVGVRIDDRFKITKKTREIYLIDSTPV